MSLKRIYLDLARDHQHPSGSSDHGYEMIAPLDDGGHLDAKEWREHRVRCRVRRFTKGQPDEMGFLARRRGGSWAIDYDPNRSEDDEAGFKFDSHRFVPGEYISITEHDGVQRTFHIRAVVDLD